MSITRHIKNTAYQLMMVPAANRLVFKLRFFWYVYIIRKLRVYSDEQDVLRPKYSLDMLKKGKTSDRPLNLIRPLSVVAEKSARVLSIGCRFETELLYLVGYGFKPGNIKGFDMLAYSPWVDCGNMHALPYADNSWDAIILGWVMTYSDNPKKAAEEVVRVARPGATVAIGVSYYPEHMLAEHTSAYNEPSAHHPRLQTVAMYLDLFGENVEKIYFQHDAKDPEKEGICCAIFTIKK